MCDTLHKIMPEDADGVVLDKVHFIGTTDIWVAIIIARSRLFPLTD